MRPLNVLLINPNFKYFPGWMESFLNYRELPLGIGYLAAYARQKTNASVHILDAALLNLSEAEALPYITRLKPDIVGISTHTPTITYARNLGKHIKKHLPSSLLVFGGPHVTVLPFENLDTADICVIGEGEEPFVKIINSFNDSKSYHHIPSITLNHSQQLSSPDKRFIHNLDELPFPARDLFPKHQYRHIYPYKLKNHYYHTLMTSRGCSFNCSFCSNKAIWNQNVRYRSIENVFSEIDLLVNEYKTSILFIRDDNFVENKQRLKRFCATLTKEYPNLKWICHARANCLDAEKLSFMKESGCVEIQIGIESGDDDILRQCNKQATTATYTKAVSLCKHAGINVWATFILGNEGDTRGSIKKTVTFSKHLNPTYATFLFLTPFPGTQVFKNLDEKKFIKTKEWAKYGFHTPPVFETDNLSQSDLMQLRKRAYRSFYLRIPIILRYTKAFLYSTQYKTMCINIFILIKFILGLIKRKGMSLMQAKKRLA